MPIRPFLFAAMLCCFFYPLAAASDVPAAADVSPVALFSNTDDAFSFARVESLLTQAGFPARQVGLRDNWESVALRVLVEPAIPPARHGQELTLSQELASHYLLGGRVLVVGLRGSGDFPAGSELETWDRLAHHFWNIGLRDINGTLEETDHRALFVPGASNLGSPAEFKATIERLLGVADALPAVVPAEDFGPAPRVEIHGDSLLIDGKQVVESHRLLRRSGPDSHARACGQTAHLARSRLQRGDADHPI